MWIFISDYETRIVKKGTHFFFRWNRHLLPLPLRASPCLPSLNPRTSLSVGQLDGLLILANKGAGWDLSKDNTESFIFFTHSFCSIIHENYQNKDILIFYVSLYTCLLGLRSRIQHNNRINVYSRHNTASQKNRESKLYGAFTIKKTAFICVIIFHFVDPLIWCFWKKCSVCVLANKFYIL